MINYKHLHYFWSVAREGSIARASERLDITPQTISGQLSLLEEYLDAALFKRIGRNLEITETGRMILSYADEIFSLGNELEQAMHHLPQDRPQIFRVGVADVLPKSVTHRVLKPALQTSESIRMICKEASLDILLAELSVHHLDLVLADRPIPATVSTRGFSHKLGECGVSFFSTQEIHEQLKEDFPRCLDEAPLLLPSSGTHLRSNLDQWIDKNRLHPRIIAEFDDSALMKAFGQEGAGIFIAPTVIQAEVERQYNVIAIGQTNQVTEQFYAISTSRHVSHPVISAVVEVAHESLFSIYRE
ncbi:MAG: transcriptional activator NhaR [gamma proteobacterium symbiont of Bathyaustriella thionipta]|nr:transcriptional activator NhaR [gamma proteobacterium symbiont of Bathyaustriella thionipta]